MVRLLWPIAVVTLGTAPSLAAQATSNSDVSLRPVARPTRVAEPPIVDGRLDDAAWEAAPLLAGFVQHEPFDGQPASERTEVRVVFTDRALYVGAWLFDRRAAEIVQGEARRDADLSDMDAFLVLLDTYLDRQNGFVFGTTPAGIEYDGQVTREGEGGFTGQRQAAGSGGGLNLNWDGSWDVATSADEHGWYAEFRIPFSTLRYRQAGAQSWGLNFARHIRRRNEQAFWAPIPRQHTFYRISLAGTMEGIEPPTQRTVTVTPYALGTAHRDFDNSLETDYSAEAGGDLKAVVTPSLTLDLTVNTDFAQVEVDEQQINLTRFNLFFPEKRPFFLENAGTFAVGSPQAVELFFSRRIGIADDEAVSILGGGRLSGRLGGLVIGALNLQTDDLPGVAAATNYGAVRAMKELPNRSRIGGIVTTRLNTDDPDDYGVTYAGDVRLGLGDALTVDAYAARTEVPGSVTGEYAYGGSGTYSSRDWSGGLTYREIGAGFDPQVGFLDRSAYRYLSARILRHVRTPGVAWFRELRPHISYREYFDLAWFSETRLVHIDSHFEFANGAFFQLPAINFTREGLKEPFEISDSVFVPPGTYDNIEWGFAYNTNLSAPLSAQGRITIGGFYTGRRQEWTGAITARAGASFAASLRYTYNDVDLPEGSFETAVVGLRLAYAFTPRLYVQSLIQYNDRTDQLSSNFRFGWLNTAGTGLFVVFNDVEKTDDLRGPVDRALIVKFTRQLRL